jgi:hypothetical protein
VVLALTVLTACKNFPKWPEEITHVYLVDFKDVELKEEIQSYIVNIDELDQLKSWNRLDVTCLEFKILQQNPFQLKFESAVPLDKCQNLTGLEPSKFQLLLNWIDDIYLSAEQNGCLK